MSRGVHIPCQDTFPKDFSLLPSKTTTTAIINDSLPRLMRAIDNPADAAAKEAMATRAFMRFGIIDDIKECN